MTYEDEEDEEAPRFYSVAIYLVDKAWGGPEEGGWWYTFGIPSIEHVEQTRLFQKLEEAQEYQKTLGLLTSSLNSTRRSINSVLSEGEFQACLFPGNPEVFPKVRPHYE
jgi:hypothetical protein